MFAQHMNNNRAPAPLQEIIYVVLWICINRWEKWPRFCPIKMLISTCIKTWGCSSAQGRKKVIILIFLGGEVAVLKCMLSYLQHWIFHQPMVPPPPLTGEPHCDGPWLEYIGYLVYLFSYGPGTLFISVELFCPALAPSFCWSGVLYSLAGDTVLKIQNGAG